MERFGSTRNVTVGATGVTNPGFEAGDVLKSTAQFLARSQ